VKVSHHYCKPLTYMDELTQLPQYFTKCKKRVTHAVFRDIGTYFLKMGGFISYIFIL